MWYLFLGSLCRLFMLLQYVFSTMRATLYVVELQAYVVLYPQTDRKTRLTQQRTVPTTVVRSLYYNYSSASRVVTRSSTTTWLAMLGLTFMEL